MQCPHCRIEFHVSWYVGHLRDGNGSLSVRDAEVDNMCWVYRTAYCPSAECGREIIQLGQDISNSRWQKPDGWRLVHPRSASRGPVAKEVPLNIASDYIEACDVLPISAKASAALARRSLQAILHANGYKDRDLAKEISLLLDESDPKKAIPYRLRESIDGIRNFGNFSAHPIDDKTTLQVIDVEPHEAEWCLEIIEEMLEHFYVNPALARSKKAALNAKLAAAGKPPSK